jgi:hypothetical protein
MLELARSYAPDAVDIRALVLPGGPLPPADAVVSAGHVLNYLPDEHAIDQALTAIARRCGPVGCSPSTSAIMPTARAAAMRRRLPSSRGRWFLAP